MAAQASVYRSTNLNVPLETLTVVDHDVEVFDVGPMHDLVTNPSRLTVPAGQDGYYVVVGQVAWNNAAGGRAFWSYLRHNGTVVARGGTGGNVSTNYLFNLVTAILLMAAGDYVDLQLYWHNGDSPFQAIGGASYTFLQAIRVA